MTISWAHGLCFWLDYEFKVITLGEKEGVRANTVFRSKFNLGAFLPFLLTYSVHNRLVSLLQFKHVGKTTAKGHAEQ